MGILSFLGLGGPMTERQIEKASKLAANAFAQPDVRMRELQRLLKDKTPQSITGALRRLTANAQGHIADEEEKQYLIGALVELGEAARGPLEAYLRAGHRLTYALGAYRQIVPHDRAVAFFVEALTSIPPDDYRKSEAKQQLIAALQEDAARPNVLVAVAPYLSDHADDVIVAALGLIQRAHAAAPKTAEAQGIKDGLGALVTDPQVSARVAKEAAEVAAALGARLSTDGAAVAPALQGRYALDAQGVLRERQSA
jgi:hypothetical protein